MKLLFAGVRGSTPVSGPEFARTGGHTSCVAIMRDDEDHPTLVLDAGTGLINLDTHFASTNSEGAPFAGTILLTHLHWDHVQGLPFFRAADRNDAKVTLAMPEQGDARAVLRQAMAPPHFPIGPEGLRGTWEFVGLDTGVRTIEGFEVTACDIPHKGGRTFGYRVSDGTRSVAYLPDHGPRGPDALAASRSTALELVAGVDVVVHGAPFVESERALADCYGHATLTDAIDLAVTGGAGRLVLTHHGPFRTDDAVDEIGRAAAGQFPRAVVIAREGTQVEV